jgi:biopolymer transport protein ExbD
MGMSAGGSGGGPRSEINVTPLVDVVLVLLIIFMVIIPMTQVGYDVNTPPKLESAVPPPMNNDQLIVRVDASGRIFINKEELTEAAFAGRFREAIKNREKKVIFFAADGDLLYEKVATVLDMVRDNGAENIGIVFDDLKPGPGVGQAVGVPGL